jgi:ketosteroid isomerase-like protein
MEPEMVLRRFWAAIAARDWTGLAELLDPQIVVTWPATGETFVGPDNFVAVQAEYPEGWEIEVVRIVASGATVVSEVRVPHRDLGVFASAGLWSIHDGRIRAGTEYWVTVDGETAPEWRRRYNGG